MAQTTQPLGEPLSKYGYTESQLRSHFDSDKWSRFLKWMDGQTYAFDLDTGVYVFFPRDVERFMAKEANHV